MESMLQFFEEVPDFRSDCGKRYSMGQMLSMITLSYMSGNYAMQATRRYFVNNEEELVDMFGLEHGVPSYDLIRTFLMGVNYEDINQAFTKWVNRCSDNDSEEKTWVGMDGKSLGSTVSDCHSNKQDFQAMVGAFMAESGITIQYGTYENSKDCEADTVRELIDKLEENNYIITLDALHCQKKTLNDIVSKKNDFVVQVKGNTSKLEEGLLEHIKDSEPVDICETNDLQKGRIENRDYKVYDVELADIPRGWNHVNTAIVAHRYGKRDGKQYDEEALYISNAKGAAEFFGHGIRGHWKIENNLHWVKDVQQNEDDNLIEDHSLSINISMLQTFALNIFRRTGNTSLKYANEKYANRPIKAYELFCSSLHIDNSRTV